MNYHGLERELIAGTLLTTSGILVGSGALFQAATRQTPAVTSGGGGPGASPGPGPATAFIY